MKRIIKPLLGTALPLLAFSACNSTHSLAPVQGHYEGTWIHTSNDGKLLSLPVSAEISDIRNGLAGIDLTAFDSSQRFTIQLSDIQTSSVVLGMPALRDLPALSSTQVPLTLDQNCYVTQSQVRVKLCPTSESLTLEIYDAKNEPLVSLTLDHFEDQARPVLESPRALTLDDAMKQTFAMEFNSRIEFRRVMEARHQAANAYLNLLPHLSTNSILAVLTSSDVVGLLGAIGDLAPFLLPSRWTQANQAEHLADAEHDALITMRGDAGVQTEGLAYTYARDQKIVSTYDETIAQLQTVQRKVDAAEKAGLYPAGTADTFASLELSTDTDGGALQLVIEEEKTFLSQALGFLNPKAVKDLSVLEPSLPIDQAHELDSDDFREAVLGRSFELRQMDSLVAAAHSAEVGSFFSWLDPTGDPSQGLGLGLGDAIAVQADRVQELMIARQQLQAILLQKLVNTVAEYNDALEDHGAGLRNLALQEKRLARELAAIDAGTQANVLNLITAIPARLEALLRLRNSETAYRLSRAKLDRLLLQGYYTQISADPAAPAAPIPLY